MTLGERMLKYRAHHGITQAKLAELLGEKPHVVYHCESALHKTHKAREIRLQEKMDELEGREKSNA